MWCRAGLNSFPDTIFCDFDESRGSIKKQEIGEQERQDKAELACGWPGAESIFEGAGLGVMVYVSS